MKIVQPSYEIMAIFPPDNYCLQWLEKLGRKCYKSEDRITDTSARGFIRNILKLDRMSELRDSFHHILDEFEGAIEEDATKALALEQLISAVLRMQQDPPHESVIEHSIMTVCFVFDRGVSHEMVRHRLAAFTQESTRYCNYSKGKFGQEIMVIDPCFWQGEDDPMRHIWEAAMNFAEEMYMELIEAGAKPQEARSVLPNSLKTEIVVSANFREWRHIFRMRTSPKAHDQMREVMVPLLREVQAMPNLGLLFEDIHVTEAP